LKKLASVLLVFLLLFMTSCDSHQQQAATTPDASVPQPAQPSAYTPPSEPSAEITFKVVLPNGKLPETPFSPIKSPARRYEDTVLELIPQPDYGRIWPYIGGIAFIMWMADEIYGFCDDEGRIICDPAYNQVGIIEKDGKKLYMLAKYRMDENRNDISRVTLAKLDGSWVMEYDNVQYQCYESEFHDEIYFRWRPAIVLDYITVCTNGKWGVIDYDGNEILPCVYDTPVCFSEGLAAVLSDDGQTYSFIDKTGSVVIGPFNSPPRQYDYTAFTSPPALLPSNFGMVFHEGFARFYENGKFGIIDRTGKVIVPAKYDFISSFSGGIAQFSAESKYGILDATGRVVLEPTDSWFYRSENGEVILETGKGTYVIDPATGEQTLKTLSNEDMVIYYSKSKGVVVQYNDRELTYPEATSAVKLPNKTFTLSYKNNTWEIIDFSGNIVAGPFEGRAEYYKDGLIYVSNGISKINLGFDAAYYELYDMSGKKFLPEKYRQIIHFDSRYLVRQDYCSGLLDENGDWVVKIPLYDYID